MKICPTCNRTYADDTLTFCLDDGTLLSAPYDPQSTLQIPAARDTGQPTEILSTPPLAASHTPWQQATARSPGPFNHPQEDVAARLPQTRGRRTSMIVGGVIVILTIAVLILGYVVWQGNQTTPSESAKSDSNVQANRAAPTPTAPPSSNVNATGEATPKPTGNPSPQWLEGVWEGTAQQSTPKMTYSVKLTAENNNYAIEYPSLRCGGKWTLEETGENSAKFKEVITHGSDKCSSDGDILVEKTGDRQLSYKYTLPFIGEVVSGTLSKKSPKSP